MSAVYYLQVSARLFILDVSGNPMCDSADNYRFFLLYHLRSLKALDGAPVVRVLAELGDIDRLHALRLHMH